MIIRGIEFNRGVNITTLNEMKGMTDFRTALLNI
jgi:hypothetical protein